MSDLEQLNRVGEAIRLAYLKYMREVEARHPITESWAAVPDYRRVKWRVMAAAALEAIKEEK